MAKQASFASEVPANFRASAGWCTWFMNRSDLTDLYVGLEFWIFLTAKEHRLICGLTKLDLYACTYGN